ncbi:hypothetical protein MMC14_002959 [Varicellaria rhodocarpa]|nr:hypothetical protein [Varicellaria rhodocarpa]
MVRIREDPKDLTPSQDEVVSTSSNSPRPAEDSELVTTSVEDDEETMDTQNSDMRRGGLLLNAACQLPSSHQALKENVMKEVFVLIAPTNTNGRVNRPTNTDSDCGSQSSMGSTIRVNVSYVEGSLQTAKLMSKSAPLGNMEISPPKSRGIFNFGSSFKVFYSSNSSVSSILSIKNELAKHHVLEVKKVAECDYFCVGVDKKLKKTANLILAVAMGKPIISDVWARKSAQQRLLLNPMKYLARDPEQEAQWGINLEEASKRGEQHLTPLKNKKILVSPRVWKDLGTGLEDFKEIVKFAGASSVQARLPKASDSTLLTIIISSDSDPDLSKIRSGRWRCFSKDVITTGVLRGKVDTNSDEFLITEPESGQNGRGKKRKRQS